MNKIKRPILAKNVDDLISLKEDSYRPTKKGYTISLEEGFVFITAINGGEMGIPKSQFDRLIKWYIAEQKK